MKRRFLAGALACTMALGLAACGGSDSGTAETKPAAQDGGENTGAADVSADNGETYNVVMQIVTFGQEFTGIADVEAAINAITEPEIGVTVTLAPVAAWDLTTTSSLEITSNEKLDLMCILPMSSGLDSISNYTSKNMIIPLDDLYAQYGQDIAGCLGRLIEIGYSGGSLYAIPANYLAGSGSGFIARQDLLDELGFEFDESKLYTTADLEPLFAAYKEKYGDGNYAIAGFGVGDPFSSIYAVDNLGTDDTDGVIMGGGVDGDLVVENMFATEEYAEYVKMTHEWYQAGYFNPDVATITDDWVSQIGAGNYLGAFSGVNGDGMDGLIANERTTGYDLTVIKLIDDFATTGKASYGMWAIPVTCENPEKTMQFLNLLYQDRELAQDVDALLACGIEGVSYEVVEAVEGSKAIIDYPEGVNGMNVPFEQLIPIYGDQFTVPKKVPLAADIYEAYASYNTDLESNGRFSQTFGYVFDATSVASQKSAVSNVVSQYRATVSFGTVDPEQALPEFLAALESAGINDIIAENQRQLDEWLAAR